MLRKFYRKVSDYCGIIAKFVATFSIVYEVMKYKKIGEFETEQLEGMLELVSLNGNVVSGDDGQLYHHTHAMFSFKRDGQHGMAGGHLKSTMVVYTAEIELRPTIGGSIGRKFDPETGTGFWNFNTER
jgi:hypothetical protein